MTLISRPTIPEVLFERIKSDLNEFAFNFFQDGVSLNVSARSYKFRFKSAGVQILDKSPVTNAAGRVTFTITDPDKTILSGSEFQIFLVEILVGGGERSLLTGTLKWSVSVGKNTGLVAPPDVSVNYITATQELMVALGVVDFGSMSSSLSAAAAAQSAALALEKSQEIVEAADSVEDLAEQVASDRAIVQTAKAAVDVAKAASDENLILQQQLVAQGFKLKGNWVIASNTPNLTSVTKADGDAYVVLETGTTSLTGTSITMNRGDVVQWNATDAHWTYRPNATVPAAGSVTYEKFDENFKNYVGRTEQSNVFKGFAIDPIATRFLLDIKFAGLTITDSDVVNLFYIYRKLPPGSGQPNAWIVAIAVNLVRVCQFKAEGYIEPTADAAGKKIATIVLDPLSGSGVSATALVNWAAIPDASGLFYNTEPTKLRSLLSEKVLLPSNNKNAIDKNATDITAANAAIAAVASKTANLDGAGKIASTNVKEGTASSVSAELGRIDKSGIFKGPEIEAILPNFLLDVVFTNLKASLTGKVHIYYIYRNIGGPPVKNLIAFAIDDTRVCQWEVNNYVEPAADSAGNVIDTITIPSFGGSGVSAVVVVNWAALPSSLFKQYSGANNLKALISEKYYRQKTPLVIPAATKLTLPSTATPRRIYTVLNDLDPQNVVPGSPGPLRQDLVRQYAVPLYLDRFLRSFDNNTDVRWDSTGRDILPIYSPRKNDLDVAGYDHPTPSTIVAKTAVINGGTKYNNKTINFDLVSTRESTGPDKMVAAVVIGDSTTAALNVEVGSIAGCGAAAWSVMQEQYQKCKIDFLLAQGISPADIQVGNYSTTLKNKYRYFSVGTANNETWTLNYRGVTGTYKAFAEGRGSWSYFMYINKPVLTPRGQGPWDALGLGDGSGTDYTDTAAQKYLFDRTCWNPAGCLDTAAMRAWMLSAFGYTGSTLGDYKTKLSALATNPDNPFYDFASVSSFVDGNGDTWQVRFSVTKYLERWRTIDDSGNRLTLGAPTVGTKIVNTGSYDVLKPSHFILQLCCNDQSVVHFGQMVKALTETIKAEYAANSWGAVNIGLGINDSAGTYFTNLYPEVDKYALMNETLRGVYDDNLARTQAVITNEDANKVWVLPGTHTTPTALAMISRSSNLPTYELTGRQSEKFFIPSRTSIGIHIHPNAVANRVWGINYYNWIKYTLGL